VGYAAVYDSETVIRGGFDFREVVAPGAFDGALSRPDDVAALFNHDPNKLLGRLKSGSLRLASDATGLRYEVDINPADPQAQSVMAQVARGDVDGSSFSFIVTDDSWEAPAKGQALPLRRIRNVQLIDVAPVVFPAYGATSVSARAEARAAEWHPSDVEHPQVDADGTAKARLRWARARAGA
jgi:uncharacterized protein